MPPNPTYAPYCVNREPHAVWVCVGMHVYFVPYFQREKNRHRCKAFYSAQYAEQWVHLFQVTGFLLVPNSNVRLLSCYQLYHILFWSKICSDVEKVLRLLSYLFFWNLKNKMQCDFKGDQLVSSRMSTELSWTHSRNSESKPKHPAFTPEAAGNLEKWTDLLKKKG